jgi:hypothetical protein
MYAHCIYCKRSLGANEVVETFPVGRRLAFDEARGRLWAVCTACGRWNLSPLETRWESIEACERLFRDARRRVSTENIGLARLREGLELVRVGKPQRPELAAWRYGPRFLHRQRLHRLEAWAPTGAIVAGSALAIPIFWPIVFGGWAFEAHRNRRVLARVENRHGHELRLRPKHAKSVRLVESASPDGWALKVVHGSETITLTGPDAVHVAGELLPYVNRKGAAEEQIEAAVSEIERAGGSAPFFRAAAGAVAKHEAWALWPAYDHRLVKSPIELRLALEMAAHEESEQRALEGELAGLEAAWREAEEIAGIADNLLLPRAVVRAWERLRART